MIYIAYRVISLTKCGNKRITFLVIFLNLTIIADCMEHVLGALDAEIRLEHCIPWSDSTSKYSHLWLVRAVF